MTKVGKTFFELINAQKDVIFRRFKVKKIGLFGSSLRGDARKNSDADVLVEFVIKNFDNYMELKFFLEDHLGVKVDLVILESLKPAIKEQVLEEVKYAA